MSIYAVNGKEPVAAWIPSLDTAGNGTTTLTDLTGNGYDGTLTNMDAATDWVADTDAGGVRALDFDGVNDRIVIPEITLAGDFTLAWWQYKRNTSLGLVFSDVSANFISSFQSNSATLMQARLDSTGVFATVPTQLVNVWQHFAFVRAGVTGTFFVNSVAANSIAVSSGSTTWTTIAARAGGTFPMNTLLDHLLAFDEALGSTDITDLYASGFGRGITFGATGNPSGNLNNTLRSTRYAL